MLCFVGAQNLNIYGLGDSTVIRSIGSAGPRDCPIFAPIGSNSNDLSQLSMTPYHRIGAGAVFVRLCHVRNQSRADGVGNGDKELRDAAVHVEEGLRGRR